MNVFLMFVLILAPSAILAADLPCTIHLDKDVPGATLPGLAKISEPQARSYALESIKAPPSAYAEGELEVEQGCLVYSFDIEIPGKGGVEEIIVDAGDGTILAHTHETREQEQAEHPKGKSIKE